MKKLVSIVFSVILLFSVIAPAYAEDLETPIEDPIIEEFQGMRGVTVSLVISGSTATCHSKLTGVSSYTYNMTISLQKQNGTSWNTIFSWTDTGVGIDGIDFTESQSGLSSGTYRCKVYVQVYYSNGVFIESTTIYSQSRCI